MRQSKIMVVIVIALAVAAITAIASKMNRAATGNNDAAPAAMPHHHMAVSAVSKKQYSASQIDWSDVPEAKPYKAKVLAGINRVMRENDQCASMEEGSLMPAEEPFSKRRPIFQITCDTPNGNAFAAKFNANDVGNDKASFAAAKPVGRYLAFLICKARAGERSASPSHLVFGSKDDANYMEFPSGKATIALSYARDDGSDSRTAVCFFDKLQMTNITLKQDAG